MMGQLCLRLGHILARQFFEAFTKENCSNFLGVTACKNGKWQKIDFWCDFSAKKLNNFL